MRYIRLVTPALWLVGAVVSSNGVPATTIESLGSLDFPNSGAPEAQEAFVRGVLLLHSFEYEDAREAFLEAQKIDSDFALAYWGESMTYNHPLWRYQDREAGLAALNKLSGKAPTEREQAYLDSLAVLYGEGDKEMRDIAYAEALSQLADRYPEDLEARSFYALSILGTTQGVRDFRTYMKAAAIVEEVFAVNPWHPGAAHYLIHSYDDPVHAPLGLRAARVYAEIAPAASHAQHMISHIYVALGDWADSVDSNIQSFEVSRQRREHKNLGVDALNFHSFHWLEYSYLQLGQFTRARPMVEQMRDYALESGSERARGYFASMRASWIVDTEGQAAPDSLGTDTMWKTAAAADLYASGYRSLVTGDPAGATAALAQLDSLLASIAPDPTDKVEVETHQFVEVMTDSLRAQIAWRDSRQAEARSLLDKATHIEDSLALEYGPPSIVKPSHELYGEILLAAGEPAAAADEFERALSRAPRRRLSLRGLAAAAAASGQQAKVESACTQLVEILAAAEPGAAELPAACRN